MSEGQPIHCPRCKCQRVQVQVTAWWRFENGAPQGQGDEYIERPDDAYAICEDCHEQWRVK